MEKHMRDQDAMDMSEMQDMGATQRASPYGRLGLMILLSFIAMYILMYAMANSVSNVFMSFNQVYMAALMASPMVIIELVLMRHMYPNGRRNAYVAASAFAIGVMAFLFIREQTAISDRQFLRSMIPHHAGAILMCENASISRDEIKRLCQGILDGQTSEIAQMNAMLDSLGK